LSAGKSATKQGLGAPAGMASGPPPLRRRDFLRLLSSGPALSSLARLRAVPAPAPTDAATGTFFSEREREILAAVVERMVDTGEPSAPAVRETGTLATIDRLVGSLDAEVSSPLRPLLLLLEWAPPLFDLRFSRFTALGPAEQDAHLEGWRRSRLGFRRRAFYALRNLAFLGYWTQEETWPLIGYAGPLLRAGPPPGAGAPP